VSETKRKELMIVHRARYVYNAAQPYHCSHVKQCAEICALHQMADRPPDHCSRKCRMSHVSATLSLLLCAAFQQAAAFSCTAPANPLQCFSGISHLYSRPVASNSLNANRGKLCCM
jgi:hypothetical protein